jgi:hypothetical protein
MVNTNTHTDLRDENKQEASATIKKPQKKEGRKAERLTACLLQEAHHSRLLLFLLP